MSQRSSLRSDLHSIHVALDRMEPGSVVLDENGAAWQMGALGYWYRAFDAPAMSSFEVAQLVGSAKPSRLIPDFGTSD